MAHLVLPADRERLAEVAASASHRAAAQRALAVAAELHARRDAGLGRRVFLADLAQLLGMPMDRLAPLVVLWHRLGWVELTRLDLPRADPMLRAQLSEVQYLESTYHLVRVDAP